MSSGSVEAPAPGPPVNVAFALGWQLAELHRVRPARLPAPPAPAASHSAPTAQAAVVKEGSEVPRRPPSLPGIGKLTAADQRALWLGRVCVALHRLKPWLDDAGLVDELTDTDVYVRTLARADRPEFRELHVRLISLLTRADYRLGKAYGLGRALADTCREPSDLSTLREQFDVHRVAALQETLCALKSSLDPHAGQAVERSLIYWQQWTARDAEPHFEAGGAREALRALRRQGGLWRGLLSGETQAVDLLQPRDFAGIASAMLQRASHLLRDFVLRFWPLLLGLLALLAVGATLLVNNEAAYKSVLGLVAVLASFGISWQTIGSTLARVGTRVGPYVWDSELDEAIAYAVTLDPVQSRIDRNPPRASRRLARKLLRRRARIDRRASVPADA